jgi:hypothetical protein
LGDPEHVFQAREVGRFTDGDAPCELLKTTSRQLDADVNRHDHAWRSSAGARRVDHASTTGSVSLAVSTDLEELPARVAFTPATARFFDAIAVVPA